MFHELDLRREGSALHFVRVLNSEDLLLAREVARESRASYITYYNSSSEFHAETVWGNEILVPQSSVMEIVDFHVAETGHIWVHSDDAVWLMTVLRDQERFRKNESKINKRKRFPL